MARIIDKVLRLVTGYAARYGRGPSAYWLFDDRGLPPRVVAAMVDGGWLEVRRGRYYPGPGPEPCLTRAATAEEMGG